MATGPKKGLNPARKVGSAPNNHGVNEYSIASGYATALGKGDPVKLASDGTIEKATNDTADSIGVFIGVQYTDSLGEPQYSNLWAASTTGTDIVAYVIDDPFATFHVVGDGPIPLVQKGDIFAMTLTAADSNTKQSQAVAKVLTELTGDVDLDGETDIGANIAGVADADAFSIKTSNMDTATTITIADGDGIVELLADLNAVDNISATLDSSGFLVIQATDGYDLVAAEVTNTPFEALMGVTAGTFSEVVAASAGLVKVIKVVDRDTYVMEVVLVDHDLRDDG